jgi:16S rRNA (cytidine1402-2'-O)-methyltransferase
MANHTFRNGSRENRGDGMIARNQGILYVVATPIGNLDDLSPRAQHTLAGADLVAAEDKRHTAKLLNHFGINTPLLALHDHNEAQQVPVLVEKLLCGNSVALVSDAGTPLISDPGFRLVRATRAAGIRIVPIPGACAFIAALSASGLPTDRFVFEGFLPSKTAARKRRLAELAPETRTLIFYESIHRLRESLTDMALILGGERQSVIARELTKLHEDIHEGTLSEHAKLAASNSFTMKGEIVVLVSGAALADKTFGDSLETDHVLRVLLAVLPMKQAVAVAGQLTGFSKNQLYQRALDISKG